jgi:hypothetical protein
VFPLLLMLSFLRPDGLHAVSHVTDAAYPTAALPALGQMLRTVIGVVCQCLALDSLMIRIAAANALVSLVPIECIVPFLGAQTARAVGATMGGSVHVGNTVHGVLALGHKALRAYVGWQHDGTQHSKSSEGLRLRASREDSARVLRAVATMAVQLSAATQVGKAACAVTELWLDVIADTFAAAAGRDDESTIGGLRDLATRSVRDLVAVLNRSDANDPLLWSGSEVAHAAARALLQLAAIDSNAAVSVLQTSTNERFLTGAATAVSQADHGLLRRAAAFVDLVTQQAATQAARMAGGLKAVRGSVAQLRALEALLLAAGAAPTLSASTRTHLRNASDAILGGALRGDAHAITHTGVLSAALGLGPNTLPADFIEYARWNLHASAPLDCRYAAASAVLALVRSRGALSLEPLAIIRLLFTAFVACFDDDPFVRRQGHRCGEALAATSNGECPSMCPATALRSIVAVKRRGEQLGQRRRWRRSGGWRR